MSTIVHVVQGTQAWHQFRLTHNGASEAAAMLGLSKKVKRSELVRMKATGIAKVFSDWVQQNVLDHGHEVEARARPIVEDLIDDTLYPATYEDGKESASVDGITLGGEIVMEHKQWNVELAESVRNGVVPEEHLPQCQQILKVTKAEKVRFVVSDGTAQNMVHADVFPDPAWFQRITDGWAQFDKDVAAYVPEAVAEPTPIGRAPETLPALRIEVTGAVTASNLSEFKQTALAAIRSVNRELKTDSDFADADKAVKWCADVESRLKAAKEHALSQTADIDALFKTLDDIGAEARAVRLDLDKLVKRRKDEVKEEAVIAARRALGQHINALNAELSPVSLQMPAVDFGLAIKGLRSIASMQDALDTELANGKIAADAQARTVRGNRAQLDAADAGHLFPDFTQVCTKAAEDFGNLLTSRKAAAEAAQAARLEAERARIRAEEVARLEREAAARQAQVEREQRAAVEQKAREDAAAQAQADAEARATAQREADARAETERQAMAAAAPAPAVVEPPLPAPAPAPEVRAFRRTAAPVQAESEAYTVRLGEIQALIAPYTITAEGIAQEGFQFRVERGMKFYRQSDARALCLKASKHFAAKAEELLQAA